MTHDEMIAVIHAHKEGRAVEWQWLEEAASEKWTRLISRDHPFNFSQAKYRVKREPREFWINGEAAASGCQTVYAYISKRHDVGPLIHVREVIE